MAKAKKSVQAGSITFDAVLHIDERRETPVYINIFRFVLALMGAYGAIFCYLTSVKTDCNYTAIALVTGLFCIVFSAIFMLEKKLQYIILAVVFLIFFNIIYINREILINGMLNAANTYLAEVKYKYNDTPFAELLFQFSVSKHTTLFFFAISFIICFLLCYGIVRRTNIVLVFLATFPVFELGMYYGLVPGYAFFIMLIACWGAVLSSEITEFSAVGSSWKYAFFKRVSGQGAITACIALILSFAAAFLYVKMSGYTRPQSLDELRSSTTEYAENFSYEKFKNDISSYNPLKLKPSGAIDHGNLSSNGNISFENKTVLKVTMSKPNESVYLRGFTGSVYTGSSWKELSDYDKSRLEKIISQFENDDLTPMLLSSYYWQQQPDTSTEKYNIEVENVLANRNYLYLPLNVTPVSVSNYDIINDASFKGVTESSYSADYYNVSDFMDFDIQLNSIGSIGNETIMADEMLYRDYVYDTYLTLPDEFPAADTVFDERYEDGLQAAMYESSGSDVQLLYNVGYVKTWLRNNCSYSLSAGDLPFGKDFVTNFITETKKGSCSHFASSAVLLLRYKGIPARYVEGYIIKPGDFTSTKNPGETDTVEVTDARGHAWVEIYIDAYGWYPLEVTSGYGNIRTDKVTEAETEPQMTSDSESTTTEEKQTEKQSETEPLIDEDESQTESEGSGKAVTEHSSPNGSTSLTEEPQGEKHSPDLRFLFATLLILAVIAALIPIRRYCIIQIREHRFHSASGNRSAIGIYKYFESIMSYSGISRGSMTYDEFCGHIKALSNLFADDSAEIIIQLALKADFSGQDLTDYEVSEASRAAKKLSYNVYDSLSWYKKFIYKYLLCLI